MASQVIATLAAGLLSGLAAAPAATMRVVDPISCSACGANVAPPAYEWAAKAAGIPASVLFAVAREESGAPLRGRWIPWPWTLNIGGTPLRFATWAQACTALDRALTSTSSHRIDVGLAQIDLGYYGDRVTRPCELLDPYRNLLIAARILRHYHDSGESWMVAIGRYHRPAGGAPAERYRRDVAQQLARVLANAGIAETATAALP